QSGSQEHQGDLAFGAARCFRVDVGAARLVGRQRRRGGLDRSSLVSGGGGRQIVVGAQRTFAPIQTATAMSDNSPAVHRNRPSVTGPRRPRARPPLFGSTFSDSM